MYPKTLAARRSAAHCCNRIEISPSRRAAVLWFAWLLALGCAIFFGVALPLYARLTICAAIAATCLPVSWCCVLVRGPRAVRRLEWSQAEGLTVFLGPALVASPAELAAGSFRLGNQVLVLRLTTEFGVRFALIDSSVQDMASFRRLCRRLNSRPRRPPKGSGRPS
jgi:hypothetical protein